MQMHISSLHPCAKLTHKIAAAAAGKGWQGEARRGRPRFFERAFFFRAGVFFSERAFSDTNFISISYCFQRSVAPPPKTRASFKNWPLPKKLKMSQPGQFFQKFENLDESAWTFPQNQQGKRPAAAKELNRKRPAGDRLHKALHEQNERGYLESAVWPAGRRTQI